MLVGSHDALSPFTVIIVRLFCFMALFLAIALIGPVRAQANPETAIVLTPEEQAWLKAHPVIRIGIDADYAPYSFRGPGGKYQGVAPELLQQIGKQLNVKFDVTPGLSWTQIMAGARERSLDAVATVVITPEREKFLAFSQIYIPTPLVIITRNTDNRISSAGDLANRKVALVKDYSSTEKVLHEHPSIKVYQVDTVSEGLYAVSIGEADAFVGVLGVSVYLASKHGMHNLKVVSAYSNEGNGQRIAVRKDWSAFVPILDKAINAISEDTKIAILKKWVPVSVATQNTRLLKLTAREKEWLATHKEIRVAIDPEFAPVEFVDESGVYSGISAEYVKRIDEMLGIKLKVLTDLTWSESVERAKRREIDVFAAISPTPDRSKYLSFTRPYFKYPVVIYTRRGHKIISGIDDLLPERVAVVRDYLFHEMLSREHPELNIVAVDSIYDGLYRLSTGTVDAYVGDIATSAYVIRKYNLSNLKIVAPADIESEGHSFGVRKDWPELVTILDKVLNAIPPDEHLAINHKWIEIEIDKFPRYWIWLAFSTAGLTVVFIGISAILRIQIRRRTAELEKKGLLLEKENQYRKDAEKALIATEQRLTKFFYATFEMVFFHEEGIIYDVNPATMRTTGYELSDLIGKNILEFVQEESRPYVIQRMQKNAEDAFETRIVLKDGNIMPVEVNAMTIEIENHVARVVSLRDITERKISEAALRKAYDLLEIKVEERTAELRIANIKLKELDKLKSMFIASVSHELRTPLNSIIGFSGMMMKETFGELNDKYKDYINRINKSGKMLLALITDIIDISKIESGRIDIELSEFDLSVVINEAAGNVQRLAAEKNIVINADIPEGLVMVTDKRRLFQCVLNFLSNAVKYSEHGTVTIYAQKHDSQVLLGVRDTGIGISQEDMPRLFEAFERIDSHLRVKAGGTGLGLYLTKKIATELLKGTVGAESTPGEGSHFWIRFPQNLTKIS